MKLIVLDADGVLSQGEAQPFDLRLFQRLGDLNRRARVDPAAPAVTLNTGRPSPYVEAVLQAIDGWQPALFENGAGLYFPQGYRFETDPALTPARLQALRDLIARLDRALVQTGRAFWQPGKTVCYSLFAHPPRTIAEFVDEAQAIAAVAPGEFVVTPAGLALNVHPAGINKGSGLQWLARVTGVPPAEMGGVGDTAGDADFLRLVGHPAAPANARDEIKALVRYVSPFPDTAGLHDILDHWSAAGLLA